MTCINLPSKDDSLYSVDLLIMFMFYFINAAIASFTKFCDHFKMLQSIDDTYINKQSNHYAISYKQTFISNISLGYIWMN